MRKSEVFVPNSNYKDKYVHLIGQDAALEAAKKTESNKSYGFGNYLQFFLALIPVINLLHFPLVPSENKKDIRSIEQTMADIQAKKRLKTQHEAVTATVTSNSEPDDQVK